MSARFLSLRKGCWVTGLALIVMGGGIDRSFLFPVLGAEPILFSGKDEAFYKMNTDHPFTYHIGNRRDPFIPLSISHAPEDSTVTGFPESGNPEDEARVLGIISGKRGYQAILKFPNGERLIVRPGSFLENISLSVTRITNDSVVVARSLEGSGDSRILETTLFLSP